MGFLKKTYDLTNKICMFFIVLMVVVVCIAVAGRYIFQVTPGWSEEMALFCFTWFGLLSASLAEYDDSHIRIQIIDRLFPGLMNKILRGFYFLLKLFFAGVFIIEGSKLVKLTSDSIMGGFRVSVAWLNLAAPITGVFIVVFIVGNLLLRRRRQNYD